MRQSSIGVNYCEGSSKEEALLSSEEKMLSKNMRKALGYSTISASSQASTISGSICEGAGGDGQSSPEEIMFNMMQSIDVQDILPW